MKFRAWINNKKEGVNIKERLYITMVRCPFKIRENIFEEMYFMYRFIAGAAASH